jgi:hypothetical protein
LNDPINRAKIQPRKWEKTLINHISDKELISRTYRELVKPNTKRTNNLTQKQNTETKADTLK